MTSSTRPKKVNSCTRKKIGKPAKEFFRVRNSHQNNSQRGKNQIRNHDYSRFLFSFLSLFLLLWKPILLFDLPFFQDKELLRAVGLLFSYFPRFLGPSSTTLTGTVIVITGMRWCWTRLGGNLESLFILRNFGCCLFLSYRVFPRNDCAFSSPEMMFQSDRTKAFQTRPAGQQLACE